MTGLATVSNLSTSHLLPIYDDELGGGVEVLWTEHDNRTVGTIRSMARAKDKLEAFDDTPVQ